MHRFDTTCPQHRLHLGSTSAIKAPTTGNFDPLNSNFSPTWLQDGATWPQLGLIWDFGPSWGPSRFKMGDVAGPIRNPLKRPFSLVFSTLFEATFPMLCLCWAQLGVKLLPKVPNCGMLELTWASMCITWLQFGSHLDHFWAELQPNIGANLGSSWAQDSATWDQDSTRHVAFVPPFPTTFGFDGGFVQGPHWACLGPNFGARCPACTLARSAQVTPKLAASSSCSAQLKAKDGQVWPQSAFGWAK